MANRQNCSYDANIKCDTMYELNEYYRQLVEIIQAGKKIIEPYGTDRCPCTPSNCPRYLAVTQKQNNGR